MQTLRGGGGIAPSHSPPASRRRWVVSVTPVPLYPREIYAIHSTGGRVGVWAILDVTENLTSTGIRPADVPACSQSLYLLLYTSCRYACAHTRNIYAIAILMLSRTVIVLT